MPCQHTKGAGPETKLAGFQRDLLAQLPGWSQDHPAEQVATARRETEAEVVVSPNSGYLLGVHIFRES